MSRDISYSIYKCVGCGNGTLKQTPGIVNNSAGVNLECLSCGAKFPIIREIPRFVTSYNYSESFGLQWNRHRKTQLDSCTGFPISRNRLFETSRWPHRLHGQKVLEAGSGAGRFTEVLLTTGAQVFSFDFSTAVDANYTNNGGNPNLHLFQGDIFNIPLHPESFDYVLCLGVIQHTPDPKAAFRSLAKQVRPGGKIAIDVYPKRLRSLLQWKYILRPITRRMDKNMLYRMLCKVVPSLIPVAASLRTAMGRTGARFIPIVEYSHLKLPSKLNKEWAILDTFDMYSPVHDHPQSLMNVRHWFDLEGFTEINVRYDQNGVVGCGTKR